MNFASTTHIALPAAANLGAYPVDWFAIAAVVVACALFAFWNGTSRLATLALALTAALAAQQWLGAAAFAGVLVTNAPQTVQAAIFAALVVGFYIVIGRMFTKDFGGSTPPLNAILASFAVTLIVAITWSDVAALTSLWHFGPQVKGLLAQPYQFWEFIGAHALLAFARS